MSQPYQDKMEQHQQAYMLAITKKKELEKYAEQIQAGGQEARLKLSDLEREMQRQKVAYTKAVTVEAIAAASLGVNEVKQKLDDVSALIENIDREARALPAKYTAAGQLISDARNAMLYNYADSIINQLRSSEDFVAALKLLRRAFASKVRAGYARTFGDFLQESLGAIQGCEGEASIPEIQESVLNELGLKI